MFAVNQTTVSNFLTGVSTELPVAPEYVLSVRVWESQRLGLDSIPPIFSKISQELRTNDSLLFVIRT